MIPKKKSHNFHLSFQEYWKKNSALEFLLKNFLPDNDNKDKMFKAFTLLLCSKPCGGKHFITLIKSS